MVSIDSLATTSAVVFTAQDVNLHNFLFTRYIECFKSKKLTIALADGGLPTEPIPASVVNSHGDVFLCRFEAAGKKLHISVRSLTDDLMDIVLSTHQLIILHKASDSDSLELVSLVINDIESHLGFDHQSSWYN